MVDDATGFPLARATVSLTGIARDRTAGHFTAALSPDRLDPRESYSIANIAISVTSPPSTTLLAWSVFSLGGAPGQRHAKLPAVGKARPTCCQCQTIRMLPTPQDLNARSTPPDLDLLLSIIFQKCC